MNFFTSLRLVRGFSLWNKKKTISITFQSTIYALCCVPGRDSSAGLATRYGLDGPRIEPRCGRYFPHASRPALGPTQTPIKWVLGLFPRVKRPGGGVDHPPHLAARLKKEKSYISTPPLVLRGLL